MTKNKTTANNFSKVFVKYRVFLILIVALTAMMCIGYASVSPTSLEADGTLTSVLAKNVFISNITKVASSSATEVVNNFKGTTMNTTVNLSATDLSSFVEYEVRISNGDVVDSLFLGVISDELFYSDQDNEYNNEIVFDVINDNEDNFIRKGEEFIINIRFRYRDDLTTITQNTLNSVLKIDCDSTELKLVDNIAKDAAIVSNTYISESNGAEIAYNGWSSTDYIDISEYDKLLINSPTIYSAFYDENKTFIKNIPQTSTRLLNSELGVTTVGFAFVNIPANAHYLRLSNASSAIKSMTVYQVNKGFDNIFRVDVLASSIVLKDKLYDSTNIVKNTYIGSSNGAEIPYGGWSSTHFVDVSPYKKIVITKYLPNTYGATYDENKKFVSNFNSSSVNVLDAIDASEPSSTIYYEYIVPSTIKYLRLSRETSEMMNMEIYAHETVNATTENVEVQNELVSMYGIVPNTYISSSNGAEIAYNGWSSTNYVYVKDEKYVIQIGSINEYSAAYDCDKKYIGSIRDLYSTIYVANVPINLKLFKLYKNKNICYVRMSDSSSALNSLRLYSLNNDFNGHLEFTIME